MNYAEVEKWKMEQQLGFVIGACIERLRQVARGECTHGLFGNCIESGNWPRCRSCHAWESLSTNHTDIEKQPGLAAGRLYSAVVAIDGKESADKFLNHRGGDIPRLGYDQS